MALSIREQIERHETAYLSPLAAKACESKGPRLPLEPDSLRTCFMRDRDKVLHSKSFRRLKHKAQVFIEPSGDHYRTRLTHTLEVSQVARTIGRALKLNEDLIEAISLGHDVGHTPFGHAGEAALDEAIRESGDPSGFRHVEQSMRVVDVLDDLNLTAETRAGIGGHSKGSADLSALDGEVVSTLESAVVRISDRIAYVNHDLDDAIRSGMVTTVPTGFLEIGDTHGHRIGAMVEDCVENSLGQTSVRLSDPMISLINHMKDWLFENVYREYPQRYPEIRKAQHVVKALFHHYCQPGNLPEGFEGRLGAIDYVAGMTDRFAIDAYSRLFVPNPVL